VPVNRRAVGHLQAIGDFAIGIKSAADPIIMAGDTRPAFYRLYNDISELFFPSCHLGSLFAAIFGR